jgi:hypothetical protein
MNFPSAEWSGLVTRLPDGSANRSLRWVRAAIWENRWWELTPSVVVSACREREGGLLKSGSALANGRGYGRRGGFAPHHDHMPKVYLQAQLHEIILCSTLAHRPGPLLVRGRRESEESRPVSSVRIAIEC